MSLGDNFQVKWRPQGGQHMTSLMYMHAPVNKQYFMGAYTYYEYYAYVCVWSNVYTCISLPSPRLIGLGMLVPNRLGGQLWGVHIVPATRGGGVQSPRGGSEDSQKRLIFCAALATGIKNISSGGACFFHFFTIWATRFPVKHFVWGPCLSGGVPQIFFPQAS